MIDKEKVQEAKLGVLLESARKKMIKMFGTDSGIVFGMRADTFENILCAFCKIVTDELVGSVGKNVSKEEIDNFLTQAYIEGLLDGRDVSSGHITKERILKGEKIYSLERIKDKLAIAICEKMGG